MSSSDIILIVEQNWDILEGEKKKEMAFKNKINN